MAKPNKPSAQFKTINRSMAILRPKQSFLDWVNSMPGDGPAMTTANIANDCLSFLIPVYDTYEQGLEFILKNAEAILEVEFIGWDQSGETWPDKLDRRTLQALFEIEIHSEIIDMMKGPIEREDFF
ncbi:hypothetical protein [Fundidesulfovibrio soli]|uniref:hypothetical protein n=1 Tax=Fundidesulfovibrio soli TaxID=2922716 RepID=UPI001FAF2ABE|nr:hypothetical protein [Fundidesulfovibrio soli]